MSIAGAPPGCSVALSPGRGRPAWPVLLVGLGAIWGLSFLFIKVADESIAPEGVALGRMLFGTATLLVVLGLRREALPRGWRVWGHLAVAGLFANAIPFTLFAYGELHVSAVLAGIWNATTPLVTVPAALLLLPGEYLGRQRIAGLGVGFLGALVVLGVWNGVGGGALGGDLECLGAAACYGVAFPYMSRFLSDTGWAPLSLAAGQLICATVELLLPAGWLHPVPSHLPVRVLLSVAILGALGTGIAYVINYMVIAAAGATVASTVTYVIPLFSTLAGVALLGEKLTWSEPVGAVVILFGATLTQRRWRRRRRAPVASGGCANPEHATDL